MKIKNLKEFTLFSKVKERLYNAFGVEKKERAKAQNVFCNQWEDLSPKHF